MLLNAIMSGSGWVKGTITTLPKCLKMRGKNIERKDTRKNGRMRVGF